MTKGFLDGVTVLDLASVGPAARASRWLADYGATVVKVGAVPSAGNVQIIPVFFAYSGHRGMRRALFDLKSADGREAFLRLAEGADVLIESFRPGVMARLGVGYDDVKARNPGIVYCSTSGFGQDGPYSQWAGHDLNYLAISGFLDVAEKAEGGKPPVPGTTVADSAAGGMHAVMSINAALVQKQRTGEGAYLDVSVADGALQLMSLHLEDHLATGVTPGHRHTMTTGRYACYDSYQASDGGWLTVAAIEAKFWANLCNLLGLPQWAKEQTNDELQDQIRAEVADAFRTKTRDEWTELLAPADTCVAPVLTIAEVVDDPQLNARHAFVEAVHPTKGTFRQVAPTLAGQVKEERYVLRDGAETDTDELLTLAGFSPDEITKLREAGAVS
ncbi:MAG: L-carnitine dehydratase/bile acid-inducible protein [Actinomycetia bacterium]|nr:L-carnitine dehydratase/bile acid-inducible protein [Actinomycetes bacterium]